MIPRSRTALPLLTLALALAAAGCEDDRSCQPDSPAGVIAGRVATGDVPTVVEVAAHGLDRSQSYVVETDSTGAYRLNLPEGDYVLVASPLDPSLDVGGFPYNAGGPPYPWDAAETLTVTADTLIHADFRLSSLSIEISVPQALDYNWFRIRGFLAGDEVGPDGCPGYPVFSSWITVVDGRAAVAVGGIEPGVMLLRAELGTVTQGSSCQQALWLPAARGCADAESVTVPVDGAAHYQTTLPAQAARVTGSVTGSWQAMSGLRPQIDLVAADSSAQLATLSASSDGTFVADILLPAPARACVSIGRNKRWYPRGSFQEAAVLELAPGATLPPIEVVEGGIILGIDFPLHPIDWIADVELFAPGEEDAAVVLRFQADDDQPYRAFANLDPGDYHLYITPVVPLRVDWRPQWYDRAPTRETAALVHVPANGSIARADVTLEVGGRIEGGVWFVPAPCVSSAVLYLTAADDPSLVGRPVMERVGADSYTHVARGLADGGYKLGLWVGTPPSPPVPTRDTWWYPGTTDWEEAQVLTISAGGVLTGIDFDLQ